MIRRITRCEHGVLTGGDFLDRERGRTVAVCVHCAARRQPRRGSWALVLLALLALVFFVLPILAFAQGGGMGTNEGAITFQQDGALVGDCDTLNVLAPGLVQIDGSTCRLTVPSGGPGGGAAPYLAFSTCGPIDGTTPVFLAPGGCGDQAELNAQGRIKGAATFGNISCVFSGATGAQTLTGTLRVGTCGGSLSGTAVNCAMGPGVGTCEGSNTTAASAGQCVSLRAAGTGLVTTPGALTCLVERTG